MPTSDAIDGMSQRPQSVDPFTALTLDWQAAHHRADTRNAITRWNERDAALVGFSSPAELVAAINQPGDPDHSCRLLGDLLAIAANDHLATRVVLQAILPGLRRAVRHRWTKAAARGPWPTEDDLAVDALSAAWDAIGRHAGDRHHRPAAVIIRHVEGQLRREHRRWWRETVTNLPLSETLAAQLPATSGYEPVTPEEQAINIIADAAHSGVIDHSDAALLLAVGVAGHTTTHAATVLGITAPAAARRLRRARTTIAAPHRNSGQATGDPESDSPPAPSSIAAGKENPSSTKASVTTFQPIRPLTTSTQGDASVEVHLTAASRAWRHRLGPLPWAILEELALISQPDPRGRAAAAGVRAIATAVGVTKDTAAHAVATLRAAGLAAADRVDTADGRSRSAYRLYLPDGITAEDATVREDPSHSDSDHLGLDGEHSGRRNGADRRRGSPPRFSGSTVELDARRSHVRKRRTVAMTATADANQGRLFDPPAQSG